VGPSPSREIRAGSAAPCDVGGRQRVLLVGRVMAWWTGRCDRACGLLLVGVSAIAGADLSTGHCSVCCSLRAWCARGPSLFSIAYIVLSPAFVAGLGAAGMAGHPLVAIAVARCDRFCS